MGVGKLATPGYLQEKMKSMLFKYSVLGGVLSRHLYVGKVGSRFIYLLVKDIHMNYMEICIGLDIISHPKKLPEYNSLDVFTTEELIDAAESLGLLPDFMFPREYILMYEDNYDRVPYKETLKRFSNTSYLKLPMQALYGKIYELIKSNEKIFGPVNMYIRG